MFETIAADFQPQLLYSVVTERYRHTLIHTHSLTDALTFSLSLSHTHALSFTHILDNKLSLQSGSSTVTQIDRGGGDISRHSTPAPDTVHVSNHPREGGGERGGTDRGGRRKSGGGHVGAGGVGGREGSYSKVCMCLTPTGVCV
jgi:hypothetical protein